MLNKFILSFIAISSIALNSFSQLTLSDPDYNQSNPLDCSGIIPASATNFTDGAGNYLPNQKDTIVFCPDLTQGSKVSIAFATNIGFTWNVDPSDTLYVFDGPNTSSPLIGAYNSGTNPLSFFVQASWNNPTGCLTLVFHSNGSGEGTGWDANVACGNPQQPFFPHIEAYKNGSGLNVLNPLDTGYVDVCFGDSILFIAKPLFPNAFEVNGYGYSQNVNNCNYQWTIGGIGQFTNDSLWFTPPARSGYFVDLRVTDQFPLIERITCKVRVSQLPSFAGTGPVEDTVCLGQNTNLIGGVTPTDTVGISIPVGEFQIGGVFAGLTQLPDGNGAVYTTTIGITGFNDTTVVTSGNDIDQLCLDIEHSYIGDLEISLTCPNGTSVSLMNAYNVADGMIPGGCGNGIGTFLGNDTNIDGGAPGSPVWTYCFSEANATLGTICSENAAGNTIINDYGFASMNPNGIYQPDGAWSGFAGCPVNGDWIITVQDNQGIDDGYIFQWGLYFNAALFPNSEGYQNIVMSDFWTNDPTIVSGQNDTLIVIQPSTPGSFTYTYNVTDDFGCHYDTTVSLFVQSLPSIFDSGLGCNMTYQVQNTTSFNGGMWSCADTAIHFSNPAAENPQIFTSTPGTYTVTYTDNACQNVLTAEIYYPPYAWTETFDSVVCLGTTLTVNANQNSTVNSFLWSTGATTPSIIVTEAGNYIVIASNECYTISDTATIGTKICEIEAPNILSLSSLSGNNMFFVQYEGVAEFECTILNRWGNKIYQYSDPAGGWDGKTQNGNLCEEGTYFYIIKAVFESGEEVTKQGFVQLKY
jgi:subtilisin-like proprotein convertase family protein